MSVELKDLSQDQIDALKKQLASDNAKAEAELKKQSLQYEVNRNKRVRSIIGKAESIKIKLQEFKDFVSEEMQIQQEELNELGTIKKSSKGGFQILSKDGSMKVVRTRDTDPKWNETALKGTEILKDFLETKVKFRQTDKSFFEMFMDFLSRNDKGELEYAKVMLFLKYEASFKDPEWKEGLRLLREGYSIEFKKFSYEFYIKDKEEKFQRIPLNFSQL